MACFGNYHSAASLLCDGAVVSLWSRARGTRVFINDQGHLHGDGRAHRSADWKVHERGEGLVAFQNQKHDGKWLRIKDGQTDCEGTSGPYCNFRVIDLNQGFVALESDTHRGQHVGIRPDASVKPPTETGTGQHGQFAVIVQSKGPHHRPMMPSANLLKHGAHVYLINKCCGRSIKNETDELTGTAGSGPWGVYVVEVRGPGKVAFHTMKNPNKYLVIRDYDAQKTNNSGTGGRFCDLYVHDVENGYIKDPSETGRGGHAQFWVVVKEMPDPSAQSACVPIKQAGPCALSDGAVVHMFTRDTGAYLHLADDDSLTAREGCTNKRTEWKVHCRGENIVAFQNEKHKNKWLRIKDDSTDCGGTGGPWCDMRVITHNNGLVSFESCKNHGQHVGVHSGRIKPPNGTGTGLHAQWHVILDEKADRKDQLPTTPGSSFLKDGATVVLCSRAHGRSMKASGADHNTLEGNGGAGELAQFRVRVKEPGMVALQFVKNPNKFLRIKDNRTDLCGQSGGPFTFFYVHDNDNGTISLESVRHRTQHIGINPEGQLKPANGTGTGKHGQFYPIQL